MPLLLLALSTTIVSVSAAGPMRGWMTWERYTCETDCQRFPETCICGCAPRACSPAARPRMLVL